jgi:ribosomal protein S18 acetylase RimI-like enzyme
MPAIDTSPLVDVTTADTAQLLELAQASDLAELGQTDYTLTDIQRVLADAGSQAWAIRGEAGYRAAGWLDSRPHRPALEAELLVEPGAGQEAADRVLDRILAVARDDEKHRPVHLFCQIDFALKHGLYQARGGVVVRHFFRMEVDLSSRQPAPAVSWPAGVTMSPVDGSDADFRGIHQVLDTAFRDHWNHAPAPYDDWLSRNTTMPDHDPSLWWLVRRDGAPVAATIMEAHDELGYVGVLGTLREARGLGLASRLLEAGFAEFARRGCTTAALHVDAANPTGAVRLYESVGMHAALHYALYAINP